MAWTERLCSVSKWGREMKKVGNHRLNWKFQLRSSRCV